MTLSSKPGPDCDLSVVVSDIASADFSDFPGDDGGGREVSVDVVVPGAVVVDS